MSEIYEKVLRRFSEKIKPTQEIHFYENSDKIAVIVDPRYDDLMEAVIRQHMFFLNPRGWNLMVVSHKLHEDKIRDVFPNCVFVAIDESLIYYNDDKPNMTLSSYNNIMLTIDFWKIVPCENILIFQKDCFMYKMFDDKFLEYDYVGARAELCTLENNQEMYLMNGGLSFRKKTAMIDCLQQCSFEQIYEQIDMNKITNNKHLFNKSEDIYFSLACPFLNKNMPIFEEVASFSIEREYNVDAACKHAWNRQYHTEEQVLEILSANPNYKDLLENLSAP
jgi:hypothetical protein